MPAHEQDAARALSDAQIEQFIQDGFVKVERAFPRALADEGRAMLWRDLPCDPDDPGDAGWHIDVSFPGPTGSWNETKDFSDWRANVTLRGRALLMLFLFSDVGEN